MVFDNVTLKAHSSAASGAPEKLCILFDLCVRKMHVRSEKCVSFCSYSGLRSRRREEAQGHRLRHLHEPERPAPLAPARFEPARREVVYSYTFLPCDLSTPVPARAAAGAQVAQGVLSRRNVLGDSELVRARVYSFRFLGIA